MSIPNHRVFKGHFDRNGRVYAKTLSKDGGDPDFASMRGSRTRFYIVPCDSELGRLVEARIAEMVEARRELERLGI